MHINIFEITFSSKANIKFIYYLLIHLIKYLTCIIQQENN